jgi:hypothetical protein
MAILFIGQPIIEAAEKSAFSSCVPAVYKNAPAQRKKYPTWIKITAGVIAISIGVAILIIGYKIKSGIEWNRSIGCEFNDSFSYVYATCMNIGYWAGWHSSQPLNTLMIIAKKIGPYWIKTALIRGEGIAIASQLGGEIDSLQFRFGFNAGVKNPTLNPFARDLMTSSFGPF